MLSVISINTTLETILIYATATAFGTLLIWVGRSIAKIAKNQSAIHDQVMGVPEVGYPSMRDQFTEIREHLCKQDSTLEKLEHEVQDNSGSSLKDAVKIVNRDVNTMRTDVMPVIANSGKTLEELSKKIIDIDNRLERHLNSVNLNKH